MFAAARLQIVLLAGTFLAFLLQGASAVASHREPTCADFSIVLDGFEQKKTKPNEGGLRYTRYKYIISAVDEDGPYDITNFTISNETWGPNDIDSRCLVRMTEPGRNGEPTDSDFDSIGSDNHFGVYGINENGTGFQVGVAETYLVVLRGHLDPCSGSIHIHAVNENNVSSGVDLECPAEVPCCPETLDCQDYTVDLVGVPTYNSNQDVTYFQYNVSCQGVTVSPGPDLKAISHWDLSNNSWVASDLACFDINESLSTPTQPWSSGFDGSGQWPNFAEIYGIKYDNGLSCPGVDLYTLALNGQVDVCDGEYIVKAGRGFAFCPGKVPCCSGGSTPAPAPPTCPPNFIEAVIDFENIGANVMPSQFCSGSGFSSPGLSLSPTACVGLQTNGSNGGPNIFDATCNNGTAVNCSGGDSDLFQPQEGDVLILQNNNNGGVTSVPNDDANGGCFNFTMDALLADGSVASVFIASVTLLDVEETPVLITALLGNGTIVDAESLKLSDGSIQDVLLNWEDVELLTVCLPGVSGAVGDITVCLEPEDPKTDSTSTSTSTSSSSSSSSSSSTSSSSSSSSSTSSSSSSSSSTSSSSSSSSSTSSSSSSSSSTSSSASSTTSTTTSTTVTKSTSTSTTTATEADDFGFDNRKTDSSSTSTSTSTSTVEPPCICEEPDMDSWCGPGRYNCHDDRWNQSECEAAGCCYHEEYSDFLNRPVGMCFKPKEWPICAQIKLNRRLECGLQNVSRDECEEQGCCWGPNDQGAPICFHGPQYWRSFNPKVCAAHDRVRVEAGFDGIQKEECQSRGGCWNEETYFQEEDAPESQHSCYLPAPRRECRRIEIADRENCSSLQNLGKPASSAQECLACGCCVKREEEEGGPDCYEPKEPVQDPWDSEWEAEWNDDWEYPASPITPDTVYETPFKYMRDRVSYTCEDGPEVTQTPSLTCEQYDIAKNKIVAQWNAIEEKCAYGKCRRADFAGCILRMAGHDFMDYYDGGLMEGPPGGSDGCIDLEDPDNKGLGDCLLDEDPEFPEFSLVKAWRRKGGGAIAPCRFISFADWIVLAAEVVMELTRPQGGARLFTNPSNGNRIFWYGRETQETCPTSEINKMPNPELGCSENDRVFVKNMGLSPRETAAIMGVHSLGRCRYENSGFDGGWEASLDTKILDTTYYKSMISNGWIREMTPEPFSKTQWRRADGGANSYKKGSGFTGPGYLNLWKEIMLDTDLCLAYSELTEYNDETDIHGDYNSMPLRTREQGKEKCDCAWKSPIFGENLPPHKKKFAVADVVNQTGGMYCGWPLEDVPFTFNEDKRICCAPYNYDEHDLALARSMNEIRDCGGNPSTTPGVGGPMEGRAGWNEESAEAVFDFAMDDPTWVRVFNRAWKRATNNGHDNLKRRNLDQCFL